MENNLPERSIKPSRGPKAKFLRILNWKLLLVLAAGITGLIALESSHGDTRSVPPAANPPTVAVARVTREDLANEMEVPAEFRPFVEVELHAKVSGYLDKMNVDFGDKVKAGQLLATIEVPELQDQLHSAMETKNEKKKRTVKKE